MKFNMKIQYCSKSTLRASQKLIPSYVIELDELNRSRWVPEATNGLKFSQTPIFQNINIEFPNLKASELKANANQIICRGGGMREAP